MVVDVILWNLLLSDVVEISEVCTICLSYWSALQLHVKDIHLRYEDDTSIPGRAFACGVTIDSISAQSADASWVG